MDSFSRKVRTFDAFPKINPEHQVRSTRGGFSTIMTIFCGLFIFWVEVGGYLGGYINRQYKVNDTIEKEVFLNMDLAIAMPCEFLHTNVLDISNDHFLAGDLLNFDGYFFRVPEYFDINHENDKHDTPDLDEVMQESLKAQFFSEGLRRNEDAPGCHIYGSIPVNRIRGFFHITAKGIGYRDRSNVAIESLNFTHLINEFSFGEFYPYINNPLDLTGKVTHENLQSYKYFAKVVPTEYRRLGINIDTNQYSLTESFRVEQLTDKNQLTGMPGIFFHYDFEPIKLIIDEKRIPFFQFLARLATILGGLVVIAGYLYRFYEKLLSIIFSKRYVNRDTEKKGGLLDKNIH